MHNDSTQNSLSASAVQSVQPSSPLQGWVIPVICTLITAMGAAYTTYSNHQTQSDVEALKANSEQQIIRIKTDTEREIKQAELRSEENIIRLKNQLEAERELRAKVAANESAALSVRAAKCNEIKMIRDGMSSDITHLQYNDPRVEDVWLKLEAAANKSRSYLTEVGYLAVKSALPEKKSPDSLQRSRDGYRAILEGYNEELRVNCAE